MEKTRKKFLEGRITEKEYRMEAIMATMTILEKAGYECVGNLGIGTYGAVVELLNPVLKTKLAAKIVLEEHVTQSETTIWPSLDHPNILNLNYMQYLPEAYTCVFLMEKQFEALNSLLEKPKFSLDKNSWERAIYWLNGICEAVKYLHDQKLTHLDLKMSNVLISYCDSAVVCDFGSLTKTEVATTGYISPFTYRAPEGLVTESGKKAVVDAFAYDIYTLGILSLELFTKQELSKSFKNDRCEANPSWTDDVYPKIFRILEKKNFKALVKKNFLKAKLRKDTLEYMINFVQGCITLNPRNRPSIDTILQHKIFGGSEVFPTMENDVWIKRASPGKISFLSSLYVGRAASLGMVSSPIETQNSKEVSKVNLGAGDAGTMNGDISKSPEIPECAETENVVNGRRNFSMWFAQKKSVFGATLNRFFANFRPRRM